MGSNKPRGVPAQRSSTSQGGRQRTDASDIKMEMDIEMKLRDGRSAVTKYSVSCLTSMQSVINKVAAKMEQEAKEVRLYMGARVVPGTSLAVIYGGSKLRAKLLGTV